MPPLCRRRERAQIDQAPKSDTSAVTEHTPILQAKDGLTTVWWKEDCVQEKTVSCGSTFFVAVKVAAIDVSAAAVAAAVDFFHSSLLHFFFFFFSIIRFLFLANMRKRRRSREIIPSLFIDTSGSGQWMKRKLID